MSVRRSVLALLALLSIASTAWAQFTPDLRRLIGRPQRELITHLGVPARVDRLADGRIALNYWGARHQRYQPPCTQPVRRYEYVTVGGRRGRPARTEIREVTDPPVCFPRQVIEIRCALSVFIDRSGTVLNILAYDWPCPERGPDDFDGLALIL